MLITDKNELRHFYSDRRVWQGIPGIVSTPGGRTFVSFYSGNTKEGFGNFALLIMREKDGAFSEPIAVAEKTGKNRCYDPVVWIDPLGRLWFIWSVMPGEEVWASICSDPDAKELIWGEEFYIGRGIMMNKPTVLSSGEWLFPIAIWKTDIFYEYRKRGLRDDEIAGSYVYKTVDNGKSFVKMGCSAIRERTCDEHMIFEMDNEVLMMLVRTSYGIGASYSYDRGNTWSSGEDSGLGGPNSRFHIKRLRSGRVLLINHVNYVRRDHLTALLSEDGGKTFPYSLLLDERNNVSYPDAMEADDGYIYIAYDRERGCFRKSLDDAYSFSREILTARVSEEDIIAGKIVSEGGYLRKVASKLGMLSPDCPNPYLRRSAREVAQELLQYDKDNILEAIFEEYPVNCDSTNEFDVRGLDAMICAFEEDGSKDEKLLENILSVLEAFPESAEPTRYIIDRAQKYISGNLKQNLSLSSIAENMNISKYYLSHVFKAITGITVTEFRNELRLTAAKNLLVHSSKSIDEIAEEVGFSTAAYFTEIFTRAEMIPPSKYRKYHQR